MNRYDDDEHLLVPPPLALHTHTHTHKKSCSSCIGTGYKLRNARMITDNVYRFGSHLGCRAAAAPSTTVYYKLVMLKRPRQSSAEKGYRIDEFWLMNWLRALSSSRFHFISNEGETQWTGQCVVMLGIFRAVNMRRITKFPPPMDLLADI